MRECVESMMLMSVLMGITLIMAWATGATSETSMTFMKGVWLTLAWGFCLGVIPTLTKHIMGVIIGLGLLLYISHYFIML